METETTVKPAEPNLVGRTARCAYYGEKKALGSYSSSSCKNGRDAAICTCEEPSSKELAFFKSCAEGTHTASLCKHCGCTEAPHKDGICPKGLRAHRAGTRYEAQGDRGFDEFYCGCHGWD